MLFKTKTNDLLKQHINIKHKAQDSTYDTARETLGTPVIVNLIKSIQKKKEAKENYKKIFKINFKLLKTPPQK